MEKIFIAAGGTGGHIYPAVAIAQAIEERFPGRFSIEFVGASGGMEARLLPELGCKLRTVSVGKLNQVSRRQQLQTLIKLPVALLRCMWWVLRERPVLVLGVGGYASACMVLAAALLRRPSYIWEPNAMPGLTNRLLSRFVDGAFVVFERAKEHLKCRKIISSGMPLRKEIEALAYAPSTMPTEKSHDDFHILVFGGSQGSRAINEVVYTALAQGGEWLKGVHFVHQIGRTDFTVMRQRYGQISAPVEVVEYIRDMENKYRWADLVICRSGTGTLSELAASGCVGLLVPLPTAADDHQLKNAEVFAESQAAILLPQKDFNADSLKAYVLQLKNDSQRMITMSTNVRKLYRPHAAQQVIECLTSELGW